MAQAKVGLVLSGGGARGAYQVGVLKALAEALPGPIPFPVITGVSVGAINAAVLAEGADDFQASTEKLEKLWRTMTSSSVYRAEMVPLFRRLIHWSLAMSLGWAGVKTPQSLLDAAPLEELLAREIDRTKIKANIDEGVLDAFAVTASSYATGNSITFFQQRGPLVEWSRARRSGEKTAVSIEHILASAALPGVFQARRLGSTWFGDGALRQTAPLSPAIHLGCDRLFLIAVRDGTPDDEHQPMPFADHYPSIGVLGGQLLDIVFNDNLDADLERLNRINATLDSMLPERRERTDLRRLEAHMVRPSLDVRDLAGEHVSEIPLPVRLVLNAIGAMGEPWVLPSYLTFEHGYIGSLIDLGYQDGKADLDRLLTFLAAD